MSDYTFPTVESEVKKVMEKIDNIVNLLNEAEVLKQDIIAVQDDALDKIGIPKALLKKLAMAKFDAAKFLDKKEEMEEIAENLGLEEPTKDYSQF